MRLTPAQRSALECAGLNDDDEPRTCAAWNPRWNDGNDFDLPDGKAAREELASEINTLSNAEDAYAEEMRKRSPRCAAGARGAARALANLYLKVLQAGTAGK